MRTWIGFATWIGILGIFAFPGEAAGWGAAGHEIVGRIADRLLTDKARAELDLLLKDNQFKNLSDGRLPNWADLVRGSAMYDKKYPQNDRFHYINLDIKLAMLTPAQLETNHKDTVSAYRMLKEFQTKLKNSELPAQDRREALYFIAHLLGDIHQPLHCGNRNDDRGGNLVLVRLPGQGPNEKTKLHAAWDTDLVKQAMGPVTVPDYSTRLLNGMSKEKRAALEVGTIEDWFLDSHAITRRTVYLDQGKEIAEGQGVVELSPEYVKANAVLVEEQLLKGGVRLARFLNDTFKE